MGARGAKWVTWTSKRGTITPLYKKSLVVFIKVIVVVSKKSDNADAARATAA
jgi:hypothetical protein